jgi:hypothetical protein
VRFFVLKALVGSVAETDYEEVGESNLGEAPRCPECGGFVGLLPWLPPYRVKLLAYGSQIGDIAFGPVKDLVLSESFLSAWRAEELTGLGHVEPVEVVSVEPLKYAAGLQRHFHAAPGRPGVRVDWKRSKIKPEPSCPLCGGGMCDAILTLWLDEATWKGEDIFVPWGIYDTIISERVVALAAQYGLANVTAIPIEEYRLDFRHRNSGDTIPN